MRIRTLFSLMGAVSLGALLWTTSSPRAQDAPADSSQGVDVQARGPVHEAYAEPAEVRPEAGPVVAKQPPDPVQEVAPDQKPEGEDVVWIPGYWSWDDEATDFTWVSGFWRTPPPGREWTPGHWQEVEGGWQWVPGFWAAQDVQQVDYLPPPPPSIDNGPSTPAPDETSAYVPGCWVYRETRYLWRPGYWLESNPDWCWIPDHYCWTPTGCVFVSGYWDYPLEGRGLLFAPVRFRRGLLAREDFVYVPEYAVQPDFLLTALFVRPAYQSYYFGDYFEDAYTRHGFTPWVDYRVGKHSLDPNFAYYRRRYREEGRWESTLRDLYALRRSGDVPRPPRTWAQQTRDVDRMAAGRDENVRIQKNINITNIQNVTALAPIRKATGVRLTGLADLTGAPGAGNKAGRTLTLEAVPKERQTEIKRRVQALREVAVTQQKEQGRMLSSGSIPVKPTDPPRAVKMQLPKLPTRVQEPGAPAKTPTAPPPPPAPKHEERPIPPHEPQTPSRPPREPNVPGPREPVTTPNEPPTPREPTVRPKEPPTTPKEPTIRREPPASPPPQEPPTPPRREPTPPPTKEPPPPVKEPATPPVPSREPPAPPRREPPAPPTKEPPTPPPPKEPTIRREPPAPTPAPEPSSPPRREPPPPPQEPTTPPRREPPPPPTTKEPPAPSRESPPTHKDKDKPPASAGH